MTNKLNLCFKYPRQISPSQWDTDGLDHETVDWLSSFGVIQGTDAVTTVLRIQPGKLAAYAFGYTDAQRLRICSDLIAWLFVFDDRFADGQCRFDPNALAAIHRRYNAVLDRLPAETNEPFALSLQSLYGRMEQLAPGRWIGRLSKSIRRYFAGCKIETGFRAAKRTPTLEEYLGYRHGSIGVYPMLDLIEFASDAFLDEATASAKLVSEARRYSNLTLAVTNDLFSASKEAGEIESFNTVMVLARTEQLPFERAIERTIEVHDELLSHYLDVEALLLTNASTELKALLNGIHVWFDGNLRWSSECPRYNHPDFNGDALIEPLTQTYAEAESRR